MSLTRPSLRLATAFAVGALLAACGRVGALEQPAPLYGAKAKADYRARQAAEAAAAEARRDRGLPDKVTDPDPVASPSLPAGAAPPPSVPAPQPQ